MHYTNLLLIYLLTCLTRMNISMRDPKCSLKSTKTADSYLVTLISSLQYHTYKYGLTTINLIYFWRSAVCMYSCRSQLQVKSTVKYNLGSCEEVTVTVWFLLILTQKLNKRNFNDMVLDFKAVNMLSVTEE